MSTTSESFRRPTDLELEFLRIVTEGCPELRVQVEACRISEYDPDGYYDIQIPPGVPTSISDHREQCEGARVSAPLGESWHIETILWIDHSGFMDSIEFLIIGDGYGDLCEAYVRGANDGRVRYPE